MIRLIYVGKTEFQGKYISQRLKPGEILDVSPQTKELLTKEYPKLFEVVDGRSKEMAAKAKDKMLKGSDK